MTKLNLELVGLNGNAFALLAHFLEEAREADWTQEEIKQVMDRAKSGDYDNLLRVLTEV